MATKFLEPGGDADFAVVGTGTGFWDVALGVAIATDFVHGGHIKSIKYTVGSADRVTKLGILADAGSRISWYVYLNALPTNNSRILSILQSDDGTYVATVRLDASGVLRMTNNSGTSGQLGSNGTITLSTATWYRLSLAYTITSTTINRFELFVNAVSCISVTNGTLLNTASDTLEFVNGGDTTTDIRTSDHYVDNSNALTDPGNIWVTAKRPNANGTTNGFASTGTGSGYGTGNSVFVNERPLSNLSFVSKVGAGSAVTEEYNIESKSAGDINISTATIVDWLGWVDTKSLVAETIQIILNGANNAQAITSTETVYTKIKGSATYPAGTGADIGVITDTSLTTVSLYECGVIVAYIPAVVASGVGRGNLLTLGCGI